MMKIFNRIAFALIAVAMCTSFSSCNDEETVVNEPQGDEYVTVKLSCAGDILDIKNSPLSRADGNDLLLLDIEQVETSINSNGSVEYGLSGNNYAYAIMPYSDNIEVRFLKERSYRINVGVIVDGVTNAYRCEGFNIGDKIVYSKNDAFSVTRIDNAQYDFERFVGTTALNITEETQVDIEIKRVSYIAEFVVSNGLEEGESLEIKVQNSNLYEPENGDYSVSLSNGKKTESRMRTMNNLDWLWGEFVKNNNEEYYDHKKVIITWNKNKIEGGIVNGQETVNVGTYDVSFKRNAKTSITIVPPSSDADGSLNITAEAWGEDIYFQIEDGKIN